MTITAYDRAYDIYVIDLWQCLIVFGLGHDSAAVTMAYAFVIKSAGCIKSSDHHGLTLLVGNQDGLAVCTVHGIVAVTVRHSTNVAKKATCSICYPIKASAYW
jgi:hypothetical protein